MSIRLTIADVLRATGGRLVQPAGGRLPDAITGVVTDSRQASPGDLFVALRGPRADGHAFVADAFSRGAAHVFV